MIMKKYFLFLLILSACSGETKEFVLSPVDFLAKLKSTADPILLDVRTPKEIAIDRLENSQSIVFDGSFSNKLEGLEHKPLFVYCASGKRSAKAAAILREKGYENVFELEGGLNQWKKEGLVVESTPQN
mgnify:CR=1 FL=1